MERYRLSRVEDSTMLGGISSQKMDASFDALSARLMRHEHFSRVYHAGSPGAPPRGDPMRNFRSETAVGIVDGQPYGAANRVHFLPSSDGDFSSGNSGMLGSVDRNEGLVDESRRVVNGNSHVSGVKNTSPRVPVWAGSQQPGETGSGVDFRDMEERDEGSSGGSQSDGSEEDEEEEDGNMDGEGEDGESHQGVVDRRLPGQKGYETLSNIQIDGMEGDSHELMAGLQTSEGFQKTKFDREISSKASTSSAPSLGMFLSPSSTIPFMNSFASPPSVAPMLGHAEGNSAAPNDMIVVASGLGTSPGYYRDDITKEITVTDAYVKENQNFNHEQGRIVHSSQVPEAVPIEAATAEHYSSLVQAIAVIPPQKDPGNQIVAFSHRKNPEAMEMQLRSALTDPLTGALMDDATILLCGHSFGSESLQRVLENNACISCGAAAKREDMAPNHALRSVILAYKREEQRWKENASKSAKRRRERLEQVRQNSGDLTPFESSRHKGVQFPYKVNDRVLIKGNKRTPERFVGRNAVITTQCLNGWYVVRTLDNGESVKLQYRSLMKVDEQPSSTKELQSKITGPNWL